VDDELSVPPEHEAGVYATAVAVWNTRYDFTIDFGAALTPEPDEVDDLTSVPHRVVARVRIPAGLAFEVLRALSANMERYEMRWGEIHRPE
jgi:hypothetical protein